MAAETLRSAAITGFDTVPPTKPTAGAGGAAELLDISGWVTSSAGVLTQSLYLLVRLPSACYLKNLWFEAGADGGDAAYVLGLWYSDAVSFGSVLDGTQPTLSGTVIDSDFFNTDIDNTSAIVPTDYLNSAGLMTIDKRAQPLWKAAGLSVDPGGYFDVGLLSNATNTNGALLGVTARFTVPA